MWDLVPWPRMKPGPPALEPSSLGPPGKSQEWMLVALPAHWAGDVSRTCKRQYFWQPENWGNQEGESAKVIDSVHSRETCFPCTSSTFKPRIDGHHCGMWDSPVGKPRGKASWESLEGKPLIPWSTWREAWNCCYSSVGKRTCMPPLETRTDSTEETPEVLQDPCQHWRGMLRFRHRLHARS